MAQEWNCCRNMWRYLLQEQHNYTTQYSEHSVKTACYTLLSQQFYCNNYIHHACAWYDAAATLRSVPCTMISINTNALLLAHLVFAYSSFVSRTACRLFTIKKCLHAEPVCTNCFGWRSALK